MRGLVCRNLVGPFCRPLPVLLVLIRLPYRLPHLVSGSYSLRTRRAAAGLPESSAARLYCFTGHMIERTRPFLLHTAQPELCSVVTRAASGAALAPEPCQDPWPWDDD